MSLESGQNLEVFAMNSVLILHHIELTASSSVSSASRPPQGFDYPTTIAMEVRVDSGSAVQNYNCDTVRSICALSLRFPYTNTKIPLS